MSHRNIQEAIFKYAEAYDQLQELQDTTPWIPGGDQKTGCIGEYYVYTYLSTLYPEEQLSFGSHSEKGWDIEISESPRRRIQVKTVSGYSKTRTISPIHRGWDELFILYLDRQLRPEGFWIIRDNTIFREKEVIAGAKCRKPSNPDTGSAIIPFGENLIEILQVAINEANDA